MDSSTSLKSSCKRFKFKQHGLHSLVLPTVYLKRGYWRLQTDLCGPSRPRSLFVPIAICLPRGPLLRKALHSPSSLLRPHVPILKPLDDFLLSPSGPCSLYHSTAGLQDLPHLILYVSFPRCLDPYPGSPHGAFTRFFPCSFGLPPVRIGSADTILRAATSARAPSRDCSHSLMFRPQGLLATRIAPTLMALTTGQP